MSIEALIEKLTNELEVNTAAVEKLTSVIEDDIEVRKQALKTVSGAADKADAKDEAEDKPKRTRKSSTAKKPAAKKADEVTDDMMREKFAEFMGVDDVDEREARKGVVKALLAKHKLAKATDCAADKRPAFMKAFDAAVAEYEEGEAESDDDLV